jgi:hypothetical protein
MALQMSMEKGGRRDHVVFAYMYKRLQPGHSLKTFKLRRQILGNALLEYVLSIVTFRSKKLCVMEMLLAFGIGVVSNKYGVNVLSQSLAEGNEGVVQAILTAKNADLATALGGKDVRGRTVLHHYVESGDLKMIKHLGE